MENQTNWHGEASRLLDAVGVLVAANRKWVHNQRVLDSLAHAEQWLDAERALIAAWDALDGDQPAEPARAGTTLTVPDSPKMLRETLCVAQTAIRQAGVDVARMREDVDRLGRLIGECDRHRPLGPDGKHGQRHTATCGCDPAEPAPEPDSGPGWDRGVVEAFLDRNVTGSWEVLRVQLRNLLADRDRQELENDWNRDASQTNQQLLHEVHDERDAARAELATARRDAAAVVERLARDQCDDCRGDTLAAATEIRSGARPVPGPVGGQQDDG